jgi:glycosyltransferase involved in cell wall biosynthesis
MFNKIPFITIFTPTYNRASLLPRLYKSLLNQTNYDFIWLIIDDGSIDNTKYLVDNWVKENKIEIQYHYKENGGMHTGHNMAYRLIKTELNICVDSDDYLPNDAVEIINRTWSGLEDKTKYSGIVGLDVDTNNTIIGSKFPQGLFSCTYVKLFHKYNISGDKKFVIQTNKLKKYPRYPEYVCEKLVPLGILYMMMGEDNPFILLNENLCIVDYQDEGSSKTIFKQYKQSPKGFAYARKIHLKYLSGLTVTVKSYIHLISSAIFAKKFNLMWRDVNPLYTVILLPFGLLLNCYIRLKIKM